MKKREKQWEIDAEFGSDIIGVGAYASLPPAGKPKVKPQIGFVRQPQKPAPKTRPRKK